MPDARAAAIVDSSDAAEVRRSARIAAVAGSTSRPGRLANTGQTAKVRT